MHINLLDFLMKQATTNIQQSLNPARPTIKLHNYLFVIYIDSIKEFTQQRNLSKEINTLSKPMYKDFYEYL